MPRDYDSYLMGSLCQSESDGEPVTAVTDRTPARRPSLGEALPKIPLRLEGCGVSVTLKAGPHVRLHKLLDKWKSCFPDPVSAPMAWPVVLTVTGEEIRVASIQDSISRAIGPDRLAKLADDDGTIMVKIGVASADESPEQPAEDFDVAPPEPAAPQKEVPKEPEGPIEEKRPEQDKKPDIRPKVVSPEKQDGPVPKAVSRTLKVVVESKFSRKKCKLNVSSNCVVSRLIRKWVEAAGVTVDPEKFLLTIESSKVLNAELTIQEALAKLGMDELDSEGRVNLTALLASELKSLNSPTPKRKKQKQAEEEILDVPTSMSMKDQEAELEFWSQIKAAKSEGLDPTMLGDPQDEEEWQDDDEALAIALSLSELT